jgi:phosphoenolpyruvate carboxylase
MLPGWFGSGTALQQAAERFGTTILGEMYAGWPVFESLVDDVEMTLARADMGIARIYDQLAHPEHDRFAADIKAEFQVSVEQVLAVRRGGQLLDSEPTLLRSIRLRNPYVDPLHLAQVDLLRRWRDTGRQDKELLEALIASVNGISHGLQGSG